MKKITVLLCVVFATQVQAEDYCDQQLAQANNETEQRLDNVERRFKVMMEGRLTMEKIKAKASQRSEIDILKAQQSRDIAFLKARHQAAVAKMLVTYDAELKAIEAK